MATLTNQASHSATTSNLATHLATIANATQIIFNQVLLLETGDYLAMENGNHFQLEQSVLFGAQLTNATQH